MSTKVSSAHPLGSVTMDISFGQIIVHDPLIDDPFNDWTDAHYRQKFAWRPGSVSFATILESGSCQISIFNLRSAPSFDSSWSRIIRVPFVLGRASGVMIESVGAHTTLELPLGSRSLYFAHKIGGLDEATGMEVQLVFVTSRDDSAQVVRADSTLHVDESLVMTAEPA